MTDREDEMRDGWGMQQAPAEDSAGRPDTPGQASEANEALPRNGEAESAVSWKIEVVMDDSGEWESDPFRFATLDEALAYARDLDLRWAAVRDRRVVKSQDPVNKDPANRAPVNKAPVNKNAVNQNLPQSRKT
jgi:hypothetical protein